MSIISFAVTTAVLTAFFTAEIIWTAVTYAKAVRYKKRIKVKDAHEKYLAEAAALFCFLGLTLITLVPLCKYDFDFTLKVRETLRVIIYGQMSLIFLFDLLFGSKAYITDDGIITTAAFFHKGKAKYEIEKSEVETFILLYTKKVKHDFSFVFKPKYENDMTNIMDYLGYEKFDGTAPNFSKQSYTKRNIITLLCTLLIFVCGLLGWYALAKPVVFVGDKIVKTDSEYVLFSTAGYENLLFSNNSKYYGELAEKADGMYDYVDHSENITSDDIAALQQMPNLKHLNVATNNIDDLTEIGKLTQLEGFAFGGGNMFAKPQDYSPIKNLINLKYFSGLGLHNFNDLTLFENTDNLVLFELTGAEIKSGLDKICEKENLLDLNLYLCTAESFSDIGRCTKLKSLVLADTNVKDLSFIENLTELEYLNIQNTNAENYYKIGKCTKLKSLTINNANIIDISFVKNLKSLERLNMVGIDNAEDYSVLLEIPSLKHIDMSPKDSIPHEIIEMLREKGIECDVRY